MSGIVGVCSHHPPNPCTASQLLADMAEEITYTPLARRDMWQDSFLAIARVHHGVVHPEPQPVFNEDRSLCLAMAGEVFDYDRERNHLEAQGHVFRRPGSDAEYCLHLYEQYGREAFVRLNGSFLLAIYDLRQHELLLVSDRFASYPLFYYSHGEHLVFGTQLRPLLKFPLLPRQLDVGTVFEVFAFQAPLGDGTYYQSVRVLAPATILSFRDKALAFETYWSMRYSDEAHPERYYVDALADGLLQAVARRTRDSHRLGILLSGGLDSRGVLAADESGRITVAFTVGDVENREVRTARRVAAVKGCRHIFLQRDRDHYLRMVDEAVDIGDGMDRFDNAHFLGFFEQIRAEADILLNGFAIGVLLKGYNLPHRKWSALGRTMQWPALRKLPLGDLREALKLDRENSFLPKGTDRLFRPGIWRQGEAHINASLDALLGQREVYGDNPHNAWELVWRPWYLRTQCALNLFCVRSHMAERTVVLDSDLLDLHLSIPPQLRLGGKVYRKALTQIAPELAVIPYANTGFRANLSPWEEWLLVTGRAVLRNVGLLSRPRFAHPAYRDGSWPHRGKLIRHHEGFARLIQETIHDPECLPPDLFDISAAGSLLERHMNGEEDASDLLALLLTFGRWHKMYGPK